MNMMISYQELVRTFPCGYELAERGADTRLIQDYLGHRNIRHTVRYTASNAARFAGLWARNNLINEKLKREEV
ncbi:tyrosine recombinase [Escherichia coli]|nr:tyrosine recombinase [Escherichia coli]